MDMVTLTADRSGVGIESAPLTEDPLTVLFGLDLFQGCEGPVQVPGHLGGGLSPIVGRNEHPCPCGSACGSLSLVNDLIVFRCLTRREFLWCRLRTNQ